MRNKYIVPIPSLTYTVNFFWYWYWSPVERTLKLFLTFFVQEKIQTQKSGRPFVPVPFLVFLRGRFSKFFWFNRTSKIGAVEGVKDRPLVTEILADRPIPNSCGHDTGGGLCVVNSRSG
jgi:hypothetical protein